MNAEDTIVLGLMGVQHSGAAQPGIMLARDLRRFLGRSVRIVGLSNHPVVPALGLTELFDDVRLMADCGDDPGAFLSAIDRILDHEGLTHLVPGSDAEVLLASMEQDALLERGVRTLLPAVSDVLRTTKSRLFEVCRSAALPVAETRAFGSHLSDVELSGLSFPVLVKGPVCDSYLVETVEEARIAIDRIERLWGLPVIVQEYLEGEEYAVSVLAGPATGQLCSAVAIKKIGVTDRGKTWMGVVIRNPELDEISRRVVEQFSWRGPMEIELRRIEDRGFVIFEINPRSPAWLAWTEGASGGMIRQFYQLLVGDDVEPVAQGSGVVGLRLNRYVSFPVSKLLSITLDTPADGSSE